LKADVFERLLRREEEEESVGLGSRKESREPGLAYLQFMRSGGVTVGDKPCCKPT
jgi:hypothetical protein